MQKNSLHTTQNTENSYSWDQPWNIKQIPSYPVIKLHIHVLPKPTGVVIPKGFCISKGLKWKQSGKNNRIPSQIIYKHLGEAASYLFTAWDFPSWKPRRKQIAPWILTLITARAGRADGRSWENTCSPPAGWFNATPLLITHGTSDSLSLLLWQHSSLPGGCRAPLLRGAHRSWEPGHRTQG